MSTKEYKVSEKRHMGMKAASRISNTVIHIILVAISVIWLIPFICIVIQSFRTDPTSMSRYLLNHPSIQYSWGFGNYIELWKSDFPKWYLNTFIIALVVAVLQTIIVLCMSYTLSRFRFKMRKPMMQFMLILGMFPGMLAMIILYQVLKDLHLAGAEASSIIPGLILVYVASSGMGYYVSKGFFDTIPKSLDEAVHRREATDAILQISHAKRTLQNRMEQMEAKEKPVPLPEIRMKLGVSSPIGARQALEVRCDCLTAGSQVLLEKTGFTLPTGSKTALTGSNGCGKTTLLSALAGQPADGTSFDGQIRFNPQARVGWFDQHHERTLKPDRTVLENVLEDSVHPRSFARTVLSCMGFDREDAFKQVAVLSGGEKAKVALSRLLLMDLNLLILDEPTNHLDLYTMEALEELLCGYGGTILFVSHDETFVRKVSGRLVRFEDRKLVTWEGGAAERQERKDRDAEKEDRKLELMRLEMRMADLTARMAKPKKGDHPEQLNEEYMKLAEALRQMKQEPTGSGK